MKQSIKKELLQIDGMTCINCEHRIEAALKNKKSIVNAIADYTKNIVYVTYDTNVINLNNIQIVIEKLGYQIIKTNEKAHSKNKYVQIAGRYGIWHVIYYWSFNLCSSVVINYCKIKNV